MTLTDTQMLAMLEALIAADGPFDPAAVFVGVGTAVNDQGSGTVRADITAAPGTAGTATAVGAWGDPYKRANGQWAVDAPVKEFQIASADDHCVLTVWYLATLATLGNLIGFGAVFPAVELATPDNKYSLVVRLIIDPSGTWDAIVSWNG